MIKPDILFSCTSGYFISKCNVTLRRKAYSIKKCKKL